MASLAAPEARAELLERLAALRPDSPPRWGRFRAPQMVAHLTESLRMATGELPVAPRQAAKFFRLAPFKHFAVHVMPIPRGAPTAPELLARPLGVGTGDLARELGGYGAALERFAARDAAAPWPPHPLFGALTGRDWGVLQYRHADHHCRQFGV